MYDTIHPGRRNLTAIRGYARLGGLPDDPRTDPQDRSWYGPHDRLFVAEEGEVINFKPGPEYGAFLSFYVFLSILVYFDPSRALYWLSILILIHLGSVFHVLLTCGKLSHFDSVVLGMGRCW